MSLVNSIVSAESFAEGKAEGEYTKAVEAAKKCFPKIFLYL